MFYTEVEKPKKEEEEELIPEMPPKPEWDGKKETFANFVTASELWLQDQELRKTATRPKGQSSQSDSSSQSWVNMPVDQHTKRAHPEPEGM